MKRHKLISKIWESLQMNTFFEINEEKVRVYGDIYKCVEKLKLTLNSNEILMVDKLEELLSEYFEISVEDAFSSGIRFATEYLLEAQNNRDKE